MTDLELIFTMLGEASTTEIAKRSNAQGLPKNKVAAKQGGKIAGDARTALESKTGAKVLSSNNYLPLNVTAPILNSDPVTAPSRMKQTKKKA
jgi:DNA-damage-inducible protein D